MKNETKLIEKEKVKLFAVWVLAFFGAGVAFEYERASQPDAEVVVVFYDDKEGGEESFIKTEAVGEKNVVNGAEKIAEQKPEKGTRAEEADTFFYYLREVEGKLQDVERRDTVLDKIETLKPEVVETVESSGGDEGRIKVYNNEGEVSEVIEDKVDEAAEETEVLKAVSGDEAEEGEDAVGDVVARDVKEGANVVKDEAFVLDDGGVVEKEVLEQEKEDLGKESAGDSESLENTEKNGENADTEGAIDMMKEIIEREKGEDGEK